MRRTLRWVTLVTGLFGASLALAAPAAADADLSDAGPSFVLSSGARTLPTTISNFGLGYDLGPKIIVPVRVSLDLDYAGGSGNGGSLNEFGGGLGVRLTTPLYVGVSLLAYNANVHPGSPGGNAATPAAGSATGIGTSFCAGEKLFGIPGGAALALQATYRRVPSVDGYDPSSFTVGLRLNL